MKITDIRIRNFRSIRDMEMKGIENALILVGRNDTGKSAVLDAIRAVGGQYVVRREDFREDYPNVEIFVTIELTENDLLRFHREGKISRYRRYDSWKKDFEKKLPSYEQGRLTFEYTVNREGRVRFGDGYQKHNPHIREIFPKIFYMDSQRKLEEFQEELLLLQEDEMLKKMRSGCCMFDRSKSCNHCFSCIGLIGRKNAEELNPFETAKLLEYKLYSMNLDDFSRRVNQKFRNNGGRDILSYSMNLDIEKLLSVKAEIQNNAKEDTRPTSSMGKGMRSIYMLSLLEVCEETVGENETVAAMEQNTDIVMVEDPEIFLHPKLQRVSGDILYRLARHSQVIFSTHSPYLLSNFNNRQIRRICLDDGGDSFAMKKTDISAVLDELGYSANDLMNVSFVFIVEGKQDKSRLPLLLRKYYSDTIDGQGRPIRIAIITTNSCTNIKTYANLKYMNQIYLKDNFLMIRDGDGKDREELRAGLCRYYRERDEEDIDRLPRVTDRNVLILKYYSFENYFLDPAVMAQIGILEDEEQFYEIFLEKWKEYLRRISSGRKLMEVIGQDIETAGDVKKYLEEIKIHVRGHNLFDIYYGRFRNREKEVLERFIEAAPREVFADILDAAEKFLYFESRKK